MTKGLLEEWVTNVNRAVARLLSEQVGAQSPRVLAACIDVIDEHRALLRSYGPAEIAARAGRARRFDEPAP